MAKRRKTRKEKISSDTRRHQFLPDTTAPSSTPSSSLFTISDGSAKKAVSTQQIGTHEYHHLNQDLLKTAILTVSVVVAELILKFIVKI